jgi:quaternary ammonium compound-resistance protein SugE
MNPWIWLGIATVFEISFSISTKYTAGFTKIWPSLWCTVSVIGGVYCLAAAVKVLPIGTAYVVWTGLGAVGTVLLGILLFKEPANAWKVFWIGLTIVGLMGLKFTSSET